VALGRVSGDLNVPDFRGSYLGRISGQYSSFQTPFLPIKLILLAELYPWRCFLTGRGSKSLTR